MSFTVRARESVHELGVLFDVIDRETDEVVETYARNEDADADAEERNEAEAADRRHEPEGDFDDFDQ